MRIRKFKATTMKEALAMVKNELGPEAVILNTAKLKSKIWELGRQAEFEVTAGLDENLFAVPSKNAVTNIHKEESKNFNWPVYKPGTGNNIPAQDSRDNRSMRRDPEFVMLREEMHCVRNAVDDLTEQFKLGSVPLLSGMPEPLMRLYEILLDSEVYKKWAGSIITKIRSELDSASLFSNEKVLNRAREIIRDNISTAGPISINKSERPYIIVLVGPTGVGKTTTLAKIAARSKLIENRDVGIICADSYRIAALEQIGTFADIADISLEIAFKPEEMSEALANFHNKDVVLIDTAGRSRKYKNHIKDLKEFLHIVQAHEIHLVLSMTTKPSDLKYIIETYNDINVNRFILTKLDETTSYGNILNISKEKNIPVSYLTNGQNVPEDIQVANPATMADLILKGRVYA
ncbi:MAG: flagellar biosynthesis protein FlhF [bacterium]